MTEEALDCIRIRPADVILRMSLDIQASERQACNAVTIRQREKRRTCWRVGVTIVIVTIARQAGLCA